jgi:hypothetical protein
MSLLPLDYVPPAHARRLLPGHVTLTMLLAAGVLTVASFAVVLRGASDEPYFGAIRKSDAVVQVGVASALIALWASWCVTATWLVLRKRRHPALLFVTLWALLNALYLGQGVDGYVDDIIRFQAGTYPGGANWVPPPPPDN